MVVSLFTTVFRLGRTAATTLRPRSGREYHKIDRYILDGDLKVSLFFTVLVFDFVCVVLETIIRVNSNSKATQSVN